MDCVFEHVVAAVDGVGRLVSVRSTVDPFRHGFAVESGADVGTDCEMLWDTVTLQDRLASVSPGVDRYKAAAFALAAVFEAGQTMEEEQPESGHDGYEGPRWCLEDARLVVCAKGANLLDDLERTRLVFAAPPPDWSSVAATALAIIAGCLAVGGDATVPDSVLSSLGALVGHHGSSGDDGTGATTTTTTTTTTLPVRLGRAAATLRTEHSHPLFGWTARHFACKTLPALPQDDLELLCASSEAREEATRSGVTPLLAAALGGQVETIVSLLGAGADATATNLDGQCALWLASWAGHGPAVAALLEAVPAVARRQILGQDSKNGWTPVHAAAKRGADHVLPLLLDACALELDGLGGDILGAAVYLAASGGHANALTVLLDAGAAVVPQANHRGWDAYAIATYRNHAAALATLLQLDEGGADSKGNLVSTRGGDLMMLAAQGKAGATASVLIEHAPPGTAAAVFGERDAHGQTPLYLAATTGAANVVGLLVEAGADVNVTTAAAWSAVGGAIGVRDYDVLALLVASPTYDTSASCGPGQTAPSLALRMNDARALAVVTAQAVGCGVVRMDANNVGVEESLVVPAVGLRRARLQAGMLLGGDPAVGDLETGKVIEARGATLAILDDLIEGADFSVWPLAERLQFCARLAVLWSQAGVTASDAAHVVVATDDAGAGGAHAPRAIVDLPQGGAASSLSQLMAAVLTGQATGAVWSDLEGVLSRSFLGLFAASVPVDAVEVAAAAAVEAYRPGEEWTPAHVAAACGHDLELDGLAARHTALTIRGETAAMVAAAAGHVGSVMAALGPDGDGLAAADKEGRTVLHHGAGHGPVMDALLDAFGALPAFDPDPAANDGATPLHLAVASGCDQSVRALLAAGANAAHVDHEGSSGLHLAALYNAVVPCELLLAAASPPDPDGRHVTGATPFYIAAMAGSIEVARVLVDVAGADPTAPDASDDGLTPLHVAAREGRLEMVSWLVGELGVAASSTGGRGQVALETALEANQREVAAFLAEYC